MFIRAFFYSNFNIETVNNTNIDLFKWFTSGFDTPLFGGD